MTDKIKMQIDEFVARAQWGDRATFGYGFICLKCAGEHRCALRFEERASTTVWRPDIEDNNEDKYFIGDFWPHSSGHYYAIVTGWVRKSS